MQTLVRDMRWTDRVDESNGMTKGSLIDDKTGDSLIGLHLVVLGGLGLDAVSVGLDIHALVSIVSKVVSMCLFFLERGGDVAEERVTHLVPAEVLKELVEHARAAWGITHRNNYYLSLNKISLTHFSKSKDYSNPINTQINHLFPLYFL